MKTALITGITGQDGSILAELLLKKGYRVIGLMRRISTEPPYRLRHLGLEDSLHSGSLILAGGDITDINSIINLLKKYQPDEIYNLAAQSDVAIAFEQPHLTASINYIGVLNILTAIRALNMEDAVRLYQASTSEMFGGTARELKLQTQDEKTPFWPLSPYGNAKLAAHFEVVRARHVEHGKQIRTACGILFNHESELRGENFVTRKITKALARIKAGKQDILYLGNLEAKRDWGYARDYVEAMWQMLQQEGPADQWQDFVIATGETRTVRQFVEAACKCLGWSIRWEGAGNNEKGYVDDKLVVAVNPKFFRPNDVYLLCGNPAKAKKILGWRPKTSFDELVAKMMAHDLKQEGIAVPAA
ncbi:GDP-mannose 4,6-dehydratase [candidate division Kazan bacterium]|uniref:GDP-mannose 4,6-dehydratase n=1 Tax=candidate division Kazan bacterium TaxID=2202143 RepID=A0A420ZDI3_UNCK3|nr:MAG: GDP-mannose 4,6-dehydratase [candidate division Kazan bacterium]